MARFTRGSNQNDPDTGTVACPFCGSTDTTVEQRKGTAMCRKMFQCQQCNQPFEKFD